MRNSIFPRSALAEDGVPCRLVTLAEQNRRVQAIVAGVVRET
ncbi:MAG: hypothetical protein WCA04_11085 [Geobacteraceae bacterium]